jgi:hypothetical protein
MKCRLAHIIIFCCTISAHGQVHFTKFKSIEYKKIQITHETEFPDTINLSAIDLTRVRGLKDFKIQLKEIKNTDSSVIIISKAGKFFQELSLPYPIWHLDYWAYAADINNDGKQDLKFFIYGTGNGLAGLLSTKVYLFNMGSRFRLVSFLDFADEKEYDINKDGSYEILSCEHIGKDGHSYWVYNAFSFKNKGLVNISKTINYPLWTKHLYKTYRVVAKNISFKDRMKEYLHFPNETITR